MGVAKSLPRTTFSAVTSKNVGISTQNLMTISFNTWCKVSRLYLFPVSNYRTWTKTTPQKKQFFWSDPYKIEVMIISLTEMLELTNFGCRTTSTIWFESLDEIFLATSWTGIMTSKPLFENAVVLGRPGEAIFADIIKIITMSIKKSLKIQEKLKGLEIVH